MKYLLDTNVCVVYLKGRSKSVNQCFHAVSLEEVAVCSIVKAELLYGGKRSNNPEETLRKQRAFLRRFVSLPFDDAAAEIYSDIRVRLAEHQSAPMICK